MLKRDQMVHQMILLKKNLPLHSKIVSIAETSGNAELKVIGSTLKTNYEIKGEDVGKEEVTFSYHKAWEKEVAPEKTKKNNNYCK